MHIDSVNKILGNLAKKPQIQCK